MSTSAQSSTRRGLRSRLETAGLSSAQEKWFNRLTAGFLVVYTATWAFTIISGFTSGEAVALPLSTASSEAGAAPVSPLASGSAPAASYLADAAMRAFTGKKGQYHGESGAVNVVIPAPGDTLQLPDSLPRGAEISYASIGGSAAPVSRGAPPPTAGIWNVVLKVGEVTKVIPGLNVITLVPMSEKHGNYIGNYLLGSWPFERGGARSAAYAPPRGFVKVVPENLNVYVSRHVRIGDYITKGQNNVWPKYVAMSPRELDKIELTMQELEREGHPVSHLGVISAFRTPMYNAEGGNPAGRAALSRHMYGDAMDIYVDNNRDGRMDDLNGDGRVDVNDARVVARAAERVEKMHPSVVGGIGIYAPTGGHSGFVHLDTRGSRARWGAW